MHTPIGKIKVTLNMSIAIHRALKITAAERGTTMIAIIESALQPQLQSKLQTVVAPVTR